MIQCPNPACQAINDVNHATCQVCQTPLVRRFLWVANNDLAAYKQNRLLSDRFQVWAPHILLDTRPSGLLSEQREVPLAALPYLRLAALPLHVPRPYTLLADPAGAGQPLLLLEDAPLAVGLDRNGQFEAAPLPTLASQWSAASPLRQLNWLRQIAALWPALAEEQVEASLMVPHLLRVDGSVLRLLALQLEQVQPTLPALGRQWQTLAAAAHPAAQPYLQTLTQQLAEHTLTSIAQLERSLEAAIAQLGTAQPVQIETSTLTDQGPTRSRNEDACYPAGGSTTTGLVSGGQLPPSLTPLVVVCDGIGGHESGNVASQLAIETVQQHLLPLVQHPGLSPAQITEQLQQAVIAANDAIALRNDQENRQERGRMGTTIVVALIYPPYLFVAHLGDSRVYRINAQGCCQITLDDDVAARETRLGYAFYRDALHVPSAGALVQALGIAESAYLHPGVQHFLLDDDSLFLLCSDGLSDFERIDAFWFSTVRPAVLGQVPLAQLSQQLVNLANGYNGHDNVTVGLVGLKPGSAAAFEPVTWSAPPAEVPPQVQVSPHPTTAASVAPTVLGQPSPVAATKTPRWFWWVGLGVLAALAGVGWAALQTFRPPAQPLRSLQLSRFALVPALQSGTTAAPVPLAVGAFVQINRSTAGPDSSPSRANGDLLTLQLGAEPVTTAGTGSSENAPLIPAGSILKIISRRAASDQTQWVRLQVCSMPSGSSLAEAPQETDAGAPSTPLGQPPSSLTTRLSQPGEVGWITEPQLVAAAVPLGQITATQKGVCP